MFNRTTVYILIAALAAGLGLWAAAALVRPGAAVRRWPADRRPCACSRSRARCRPSRCASPTARRWCRANSRATGRWCSSASPIARTSARPRWPNWRRRRSSGQPLPDATRPRVLFVSVDPERDTPRPHRRIRPRLPPRHARRHRRRPGAGSLRRSSLSLVFTKVPPPKARRPTSTASTTRATMAVLDPQGRMAGFIQPAARCRSARSPRDLAAPLTQAMRTQTDEPRSPPCTYVLPHRLLSSLARKLAYSTHPRDQAVADRHGRRASSASTSPKPREPDPTRLSDLQCLLHPRAEARRARARSRSARAADARRRPHQRMRAHRRPRRRMHEDPATSSRPRARRSPPRELLGDEAAAQPFDGGVFATVYLSPQRLPPRAHALDRHAARDRARAGPAVQRRRRTRCGTVSRLFARNERLVCHFDTDFGPMARGDGRRAAGLGRGNRVERRRDPALRRPDHGQGLPRRGHRAGALRRDGALQLRLDGDRAAAAGRAGSTRTGRQLPVKLGERLATRDAESRLRRWTPRDTSPSSQSSRSGRSGASDAPATSHREARSAWRPMRAIAQPRPRQRPGRPSPPAPARRRPSAPHRSWADRPQHRQDGARLSTAYAANGHHFAEARATKASR